MAVLRARRIGNIRTPMPITIAELSSISAAPVTNNAVEPLRSAERTMPIAMRLPTPYAKKPARKRTPTIRAVRRTLESGRTTGGEVEWLEAGIGSTRKMTMVSHPVRECDVLRRKSMVSGSRQRRDDYYHDRHYTRHPADRQEWSRRRRATDGQAAARRRGAIVIFACDSRTTRRGPRGVGGGRRGQLREHNEDAPALRRSFFQAGHAGSIPVTRSPTKAQIRAAQGD